MKIKSGVEPLKTFPPEERPDRRAADNSNVPFLLVIGGATATGKSSLALALAQRFEDAIIISADSRQVYREFDLGTAKPSLADRQRIPHYLIDRCDPTETFTVAQYQQQAQDLIESWRQCRTGQPLLVGGTGLYIDSVVRGLKIPPVAPQPDLRKQLTALGQAHCYALLQSLDPVTAQRIHPNDPVRTIRALEVGYVAGQPPSHLQGEVPPPYPILYLGLDCDPEALGRRIAQRTQSMVEQGLVQEVADLVQKYGPDLPLLQTLGYAEMLPHLQGDCTLPAAIEAVVLHTRQFAKRQRTWFRHRAQVHWLDADAKDLVDQAWALVQERKKSPLDRQCGPGQDRG
ncbi:MAG TPA: tRNA (adenosine(37)-N6)-dimethylallyltransferase MiaA [Leptolyngbyaceae cyanobacterium M65_K2018_010]|nr:tRNA (adenosine(37)-N6)-dimethylallyltransferase MiaA [Leptolyngbyaceae cyanobacterium M65_K2018_010]